MKNVIHITSFFIFMAVSTALVWQTVDPIIETEKLIGAVVADEPPTLNRQNILSGKFARSVDKWIENHLGFREPMVRLNNQINYSLFKDTSRKGTQIVLGQNSWLYERGYIVSAMNEGALNQATIDQLASGLADAQALCQSKGADFFVIFAPSKAELYPENLPQSYQKRLRRPNLKNDYDRAIPALEKAGVNLIDGVQWFHERKSNAPEFPLFSPGGTHWGIMASFEFLQHAITRINQSPFVSIEAPKASSIETTISKELDIDILNVLNLMNPDSGKRLMQYPNIEHNPNGTFPRPKLTVIGDSFSWQIIDHLRRANSVTDVDMYFYMQTKYAFTPSQVVTEKVTDFTFGEELKEGDIVIALCNEMTISSLFWQFYNTIEKESE